MRSEQIDKFNDEIIKLALSKIDKDKAAEVLAESIQKRIGEEFEALVNNGLDFEYWITEMLTNEKTAAGKVFQKAIKDITKKMADAI